MPDAIGQLLGGIPPVTRCILAASVILMALTSLDIITTFSLYFSVKRIVLHKEIWRIFTSVLYFGDLSFHFLWEFYMTLVYCGKLEEESYDLRKADFAWIVFCAIFLICVFASLSPRSLFLSGALISSLTYLWGRKNPHARMLIVFFSVSAPYLPWTLAAISFVAGFQIIDHLIGIVVGHILFFFDDVFPLMPISKGARPLQAPHLLKRILEPQTLHRHHD
eukprot:Gregarina_sp_Poly_1__1739@NODE_1448_length_4128_cov_67_748092_g960_i0_p3_GENE_NODE_1448_length_4128_cov_67_748092_g960_i0NODE_1448_length_4128_cov_67_748092_g960_i0_p3_ORF_typecomplete_len221_score19_98DER1/PF04511_15/1_5e54Rhomboid/PF01694_22/8_3e03Rhomboid/PF01694_22/2_6e05PqiA/PF04403_13/6_4e03PqiA/PF04403_13/0_14_NODE_1448_length_4128_cov_67_748092_g960_i0102764